MQVRICRVTVCDIPGHLARTLNYILRLRPSLTPGLHILIDYTVSWYGSVEPMHAYCLVVHLWDQLPPQEVLRRGNCT